MLVSPYSVPVIYSQWIGDSVVHEIPLIWEGETFNPIGWGLVFTAKCKTASPDVAAQIQKASGAGISVALVAGVWVASVEIVPADTVALSKGVLAFDIQAQNTTSGAVRTVAFGRLALDRDITREAMTSIPIHTSQPPAPIYVAGGEGYPYVVSIAAETIGSATFVAANVGGVVPAYGPNRPAIGFVKESVTAGQSAQVFGGGELNGLSGLTVGATYYLGESPSTITATPPTTGFCQSVGVAVAPDTLLVEISEPVYLV